jgi:vacuolar-type H+-ATPase subunit H
VDSLQDYLDQIEDLLESSKSLPFSTKVSVEKGRLFEIIGEIRLNLPAEIRQAQRIIEDHDKILADARSKGAKLLKEAEEEAKIMVNEHEIFRRATEQANETIEDAKKTARDYRNSTLDYADGLLEKTEEMIREAMENIDQQFKLANDFLAQTVDVLYENRQSMRGR